MVSDGAKTISDDTQNATANIMKEAKTGATNAVYKATEMATGFVDNGLSTASNAGSVSVSTATATMDNGTDTAIAAGKSDVEAGNATIEDGGQLDATTKVNKLEDTLSDDTYDLKPVDLNDPEEIGPAEKKVTAEEVLRAFDKYEVKASGKNAVAAQNVTKSLTTGKERVIGKAGDVLFGVKGVKEKGSTMKDAVKEKKRKVKQTSSPPKLTSATATYNDEYQDVDVIGTMVKDATSVIQEEALKGQNTADSPLDNPFLLVAAPVLPIAVMIAYTVAKLVLPFLWAVLYTIMTLLGWRFWVWSFFSIFALLVLNYSKIQQIEALKPVSIQKKNLCKEKRKRPERNSQM